MILQGKGGVGKSMAAAMLTQYKIHQEQPLLCIDTDPVNATFAGYQQLNVQKLDIMDGDEINTRAFDTMLAWITETEEEVIIDNGASCFVPLSSYLINNAVPSMLQELDYQTIIHTVLTGGQALMDTLHGFDSLMKQFPDECRFVVWLNPYFGAVEVEGVPFIQTKLYDKYKNRIAGTVEVPSLKHETFGRDFSDMLKSKKIFSEVSTDLSLNIMVKQRLTMIKRQIFGQLDAVAGL